MVTPSLGFRDDKGTSFSAEYSRNQLFKSNFQTITFNKTQNFNFFWGGYYNFGGICNCHQQTQVHLDIFKLPIPFLVISSLFKPMIYFRLISWKWCKMPPLLFLFLLFVCFFGAGSHSLPVFFVLRTACTPAHCHLFFQ